MKWGTIKLGEIATVTSSKRIFANQYTPSGIPFYRQKEIIDKRNRVEISDPLFISENTYFEIKNKFGVPQNGDLLITAVGVTLGIPYVVSDEVFYFKDGNLVWLKEFKNDVNSKYVYYWITSDIGQKSMWSRIIGAAQPALTIDSIKQFEIQLPSIELQNKIVDVLSAYDDLIENNQKQIKLLEEAARRLYKEWFVDLRFPGYENTPIIDGVPQGWRMGVLDDLAYESGKNEKKEKRDNYEYYLPIDCLPKQSLGYTEMADISLAESSLISFAKDDIIFGAMRPYFHKVIVARDCGLTRSTCFVLNSRQNEFWSYLTMLMFFKDTVDYATQISVGTTMPYVRWKDLKQMSVIIPSKMIADKFQSLVKPIVEKIGCLSAAIINLRQARDRLLPKLMSGELEV